MKYVGEVGGMNIKQIERFKSDDNREVLEGFIYWFTHSNGFNPSDSLPFPVTTKGLYEAIETYIEEDHVYGRDNDEDSIRSTINVNSSEGLLVVDYQGVVLECHCNAGSYLSDIASVNIAEYRAYWDIKELFTDEDIDILDVETTDKQGITASADDSFRGMIDNRVKTQ